VAHEPHHSIKPFDKLRANGSLRFAWLTRWIPRLAPRMTPVGV
jgi:hypothetical protein